MRYLPKSPAERQEMLSAIGARSITELFSGIPERYRLREALSDGRLATTTDLTTNPCERLDDLGLRLARRSD